MAEGVFRKGNAGAPEGYFAWEAAGLAWLADAPRGAAVVEVLDVGADHLDLRRLTFANPDPASAEAFGAALARTHDAGAAAYGSPPDGWTGDGFLGPASRLLPLPLTPVPTWGEFYAEQRLRPVLTMAVQAGHVRRTERGLLETVIDRVAVGRYDDGASPARIHGDLWAGNVAWTPHGAVLIDPAAHGGHRVADLAMLALFGCPHWDFVVEGYLGEHRLDAEWRRHLGLHQLHPLLVHAVLFGRSYAERAVAVARTYR